MSNDDFRFLVDLLTTSQEKSFIADLLKDPDDQAARNAYIDFLLENGREETAFIVEKGYTPTGIWSISPTCSPTLSGRGVVSSGSSSSMQIPPGVQF